MNTYIREHVGVERLEGSNVYEDKAARLWCNSKKCNGFFPPKKKATKEGKEGIFWRVKEASHELSHLPKIVTL